MTKYCACVAAMVLLALVSSRGGAGSGTKPGALDMDNDLTIRTDVILIIAAIHATYFALIVTKNGAKEAARKYGRELILSTEALMGGTRAARVSPSR
jgi:hypothetical protein